ncbi:MAG: CPBP family intramembrane metalloprotease [Chloroflexi bacterium]|nr:CPBP family intramembrane metalloprotease [Chloroflexota bacterium]
MKNYFRDFIQDSKHDARAFAQNRSALMVANLLLLPWFLVIVTGRNLEAWQPLAVVFGVMFAYWFFTRQRVSELLPVRQPIIESALALALVLAWMLFRIGQYANVYELPQLSVAAIPDVFETIAPKLIEMVILPLALWLALRYRPRELGIRIAWRAWIPALAPMAALIFLGLHNNKPGEWWDSLIYFFLGAGLPEEFLFRGLLQARLEALLKNPAWALYLAAFVFGASHLPINLSGARPDNWLSAFESAFTFQLSVGFALGYAFYRVRNLAPLMVLHTLIDAAP